MSNELQIEDFERDNMDGEIHTDKSCHIEPRSYKYKDASGHTRKLCIIFMVCKCGTKSSNPLLDFDLTKSLISGECVDPHLPDKGCHYTFHKLCEPSNTRKKKGVEPPPPDKFRCKCLCYCRHEQHTKGR